MNSEEIQSLIKQLKAAGLNEEEIMDTFYETFSKGEMDRKDLEALAEAMGYELTDDFKNDATPDPIASEGAEGASKADLEGAKELAPGETAEEFKDKIDAVKEGEGNPAPAEGKPEDEKPEEGKPAEGEPAEGKPEEGKPEEGKPEENGESEEKEWEEAQKLFKI